MSTVTPTDPWLPVDYTSALRAPTIECYRYDAQRGEMELLDSIEFLGFTDQEGGKPSVARFRYVLGVPNNDWNPSTLEQCLGDQFNIPGVVKPGDRLVAKAYLPAGAVYDTYNYEYLFDGFPFGFEGDWDENSEEVILTCRGVECRAWDIPIRGMLMRDASKLDVSVGAAANVQTTLPAVFNPRGTGNCIPNGTEVDSDDPDKAYPIFMDVLAIGPPDRRTKWRLPDAVKYLLATCNKNETYFKNPKFTDLDNILFAREPKDGGNGTIDPADSSTYDEKNIYVSNIAITGRDLRSVLHTLVGDKGFLMRFELGVGGDGMPETRLIFQRAQDGPVKAVRMQARGEGMDVDLSNVGQMSITRDITDAPNYWIVDGGLWRYQVGFILQCGYPSAGASDAAAGSNPSSSPYVTKNHILNPENINAYRLYVADECGDGVYGQGSDVVSNFAFDFRGVFGEPDTDGTPKYIVRRRPPYGTLIATDALGKPIPCTLEWSTDYSYIAPVLWDSALATAKWHLVNPESYKVLSDRVGIYITADDPESWSVGRKIDGATAFVLKGVKSQAAPDAANPMFWLRFNCTIDGDAPLQGVAPRRPTAALPYDVERRVDARDRFQGTIIHQSSNSFDASKTPQALGTGTRKDINIIRDDTEAAKAEAMSLRDATDSGILDGPIVVNRLTTEYKIGDRISEVYGRSLGFRTDTGGQPTGDGTTTTTVDAPVLPVVTSRRFDIYNQTVTLEVSDSNRGRESYRRRSAEKGGHAYREGRHGRRNR